MLSKERHSVGMKVATMRLLVTRATALSVVCRKRPSSATRLALCAVVIGAWYGPVLCGAQTHTSDAGENPAVLLRHGVDLAAQGQFAKAEVILERAHTLAPKNADVLTALAKTKARLGEREAATDLFRRVTAMLPNSPNAHLYLAIANADQGNFNGALVEVTKALELAPDSGLAHLNRARILSDLNRRPEAEAEFKTACKLLPSNSECFFYWALLERQMGNFAKETSLLRTVVKLQPGNDEAWVLLGKSLNYQSEQAEAIVCWKKALAINPNSQEARYSLSRALRATDPAESRTLDKQFFSSQQKANLLEQVKGLGNQAYVAINHQKWPLAISTLRHAIDLCGDCEVSANLHKDLGLALCQSGNLNEGRQELEVALRQNPNDPDILKALAVLSSKVSNR
jgi:tetratricopeptide (TPR) repeat protein